MIVDSKASVRMRSLSSWLWLRSALSLISGWQASRLPATEPPLSDPWRRYSSHRHWWTPFGRGRWRPTGWRPPTVRHHHPVPLNRSRQRHHGTVELCGTHPQLHRRPRGRCPVAGPYVKRTGVGKAFDGRELWGLTVSLQSAPEASQAKMTPDRAGVPSPS